MVVVLAFHGLESLGVFLADGIPADGLLAVLGKLVVGQERDDGVQVVPCRGAEGDIAHSTFPLSPVSTSSGTAITTRPFATSTTGTKSRAKGNITVSPSPRAISMTSPAP